MLHAKDFRDRARSHLGPGWTSKKWGTFAVIALVYSAIEAVVSFLGYIFYIGYIAQLIILGPFALGFAIVSTKFFRRFQKLRLGVPSKPFKRYFRISLEFAFNNTGDYQSLCILDEFLHSARQSRNVGRRCKKSFY